MERKNAAAAAEAESTLDDAEAQETERRSTKRSSKADTQRSGSAQHEHRRQDGWTSTHLKRNAVNETGLQGSDCRINSHTRSWELEVKKMHTELI